MDYKELIESIDVSDYKIVDCSDGRLKYDRAKAAQPGLDLEKTIMLGMADMEYAFPKYIYDKLFEMFPEAPSFGYTDKRQTLWTAVQKWVSHRYCPDIKLDTSNTLFWIGSGPIIAAAIQGLTQKKDAILVFVPTYYGYITNLQYYKRKIVECPLSVNKGRYYIDFEALENCLKENQIKLFLFMSPWNPCGRIWSYDELSQLKDLLIKYKVYIMSDEIFGDSVDVPDGEHPSKYFTSMLAFKDVYPYLVQSCSPSKSINYSGMATAYSVIPNPQIFKIMKTKVEYGFWPPKLSLNMLQVMLTTDQGQNWRKNTIKYIRSNYLLFKKLCAEKVPKLQIFELECSFLMVIDFKDYADKINIDRLDQYFTKVNVCPIFMKTCYMKFDHDFSRVRINLGVNQDYIPMFVDRLAQMVELPWIE